MSATGSGSLFITHIVTVAPRMLAAGVAFAWLLVLLLLLLPQAATASARTRQSALRIARRLFVNLVIISPTSLLTKTFTQI